jgi:hypothetical protein
MPASAQRTIGIVRLEEIFSITMIDQTDQKSLRNLCRIPIPMRDFENLTASVTCNLRIVTGLTHSYKHSHGYRRKLT